MYGIVNFYDMPKLKKEDQTIINYIKQNFLNVL